MKRSQMPIPNPIKLFEGFSQLHIIRKNGHQRILTQTAVIANVYINSAQQHCLSDTWKCDVDYYVPC